jgi:2TM domain
MPNKIAPTSKQKSALIIHAVIFIIANAVLWYTYDKGFMRVDVKGWAYVWPIWITAAWGLSWLGHWAALYTNYEDAGSDEYQRQLNN